MTKIKLISFADGPFAPRKRPFIEQAQSMRMFDQIIVHSIGTLPQDFVTEHLAFMQKNPRGFGYWIWKPRIVLETMLASEATDVIFYADVGYTINPGGRDRMIEYADIARASPYSMLSFYSTHTEYMWTKGDLAAHLGALGNAVIMGTSQIAAGLFALLPTDSNIQIMRQWSEIALANHYHFSDDSPSRLKNDRRFREHRHDQSIGSLLRKMRGTTISHYEVQPYDFFYEQYRPTLPMWATRLKE